MAQSVPAAADAANHTAPGRARIAGRIESVRSNKGANGTTFRTLMRLPAVDRFSSPGTVEVRSDERLGARDDEVSILVELTGYARSYKADGDDGDKVTVRTAENVLRFIGHA